MGKEYGDYEQVNGAVVNGRNAKLAEAERTIEKQKDHIALLLAAYRGKVDKDDELLAEIGEDYAEHGATIAALKSQLAGVREWFDAAPRSDLSEDAWETLLSLLSPSEAE